MRFPHGTSKLLAYQAVITRAERNYEGTRSVSYDRRYRWEALAQKDLDGRFQMLDCITKHSLAVLRPSVGANAV